MMLFQRFQLSLELLPVDAEFFNNLGYIPAGSLEGIPDQLLRDYCFSGSECYQATYTKPEFSEKSLFSSIMYGKYIYDERPTKYSTDGSFTKHYGLEKDCEDVPNWFLKKELSHENNVSQEVVLLFYATPGIIALSAS